MKKLIFLLGFLPLISFSQVSNWRNTTPTQSTNLQNNYKTTQNSTNESKISYWRSETPQNNYVSIDPPRFRGGYGFLGFNRWYGWGAPMTGFNYWTPSYYYNRWGVRQPSRIYHYNDGRRDTIKGTKTNFAFGVQNVSFSNKFGAWMAVGNKTYFVLEYNNTIQRDNSYYASNKTIWNYYNDRINVNGVSYTMNQVFPLVSDYVSYNSMYAGLGRRFKKVGFHIMLGYDSEVRRFRYKDDVGYITFPKNKDVLPTLKVGTISNIKAMTLKLDVDPIMGRVFFGAGLNF